MIDSDDRDDPVLACPDCGQRMHGSQAADDGRDAYCCPWCGADLVPGSTVYDPVVENGLFDERHGWAGRMKPMNHLN